MTRKPSPKSHAAAAVLSAGVFMASGSASAQGAAKAPAPGMQPTADRMASSIHIKFAAKLHKDRDLLSVAGMLDRRPVFKNARGEYFQVDPNTGDLTYHTAESLGFIKITDRDLKGRAAAPRSNIFIKFDGIKGEQKVTLLGVDAQGNVLQENSRGERFYLGANGDMVFVK
ncbi:MAG: hypothetical protein IPN59_08035 [Holophaga sp.]|nr:hypothetical protein [Holophaga sp.]